MPKQMTARNDLEKSLGDEYDIQFYDFHPELTDFYSEVIEGLQASPKKIPPKFFYDEPGSKIFEQICESPEYYPTRTEQAILKQHANDIAQILGNHPYIIEPGCGSCEKIKLLLDNLKPKAYVPMDISKDFLQQSAQGISDQYPWLDVHAACVDFTAPISLPFCPDGVRKLAFFPGSSIGNFEPQQASVFLQQVADMVGEDGGLLIGVDLKKNHSILNDAYNDKAGVTADFNLNLLTRMNSELNADFDLNAFEHHAFYNDDLGRIEMHLVSQKSQNIQIGDHQIEFNPGETIHTESSYKYSIQEFQDLGQSSGFNPVQVWTDENDLFSVHYFETQKAA